MLFVMTKENPHLLFTKLGLCKLNDIARLIAQVYSTRELWQSSCHLWSGETVQDLLGGGIERYVNRGGWCRRTFPALQVEPDPLRHRRSRGAEACSQMYRHCERIQQGEIARTHKTSLEEHSTNRWPPPGMSWPRCSLLEHTA